MASNNSTSQMKASLHILNFTLEPLIYVFAFIGNAVTLAALLRCRLLRNVKNALIISLAVADMLLGVTGLVTFIVTQVIFQHEYNKTERIILEHILPYISGIPVMASLLHLVALSLERTIAIFMPLRHRKIVGVKFMMILIITAWMLGAFLVVIYAFFGLLSSSERLLYTYALYGTITSNIIYESILFSMLFMGIKAILVVREKKRRVPGQTKPSGEKTGINKATKRISLILFAYIFTCGPYCLSTFVHLNPLKYTYFINNILPFFSTLILLNSCLNVLIYTASSAKYRQAYKTLYRDAYKYITHCTNKV